MIPEAFTDDWARAWCRRLGERPAFRSAAAAWNTPVVLSMTRNGSPERRGVFIHLQDGTCTEARVALSGDLAAVPIALEAPAAVWRDLFEGLVSPLHALMGGRLHLIRGTLSTLLPFAGAARELMQAATEVETRFPDGWL